MTLTRKRPRSGAQHLSKRVIGNATVVHLPNRISEQTKSLAMWLARDPHHDLVVVDLPPDSPAALWDSVARVLPRSRRGVRLVVGGRARETTALAGQWLAERLGRSVVAPDGVMRPSARGGLFVHSGRGTGWVRFQAGKPPRWEAKRFPQPRWDCALFADDLPTSARGVAEPIPGGMWIRPVGAESQQREHRWRLVATLPCRDDLVTIVVGCPGSPAVTLDDVARLWIRIPADLRERIRFAQFGPVALPPGTALGQALADLFGEPLACYTGLPVASQDGADVFTVGDDGGLGWRTFAQELGYSPTAADAEPALPRLLGHRPPVDGVPEVAPAVYWYAPDAVIEVVQSGLWIRGPVEGANAAVVRAARTNRAVHTLTFESEPGVAGERMRQLATDVLAQLDPRTREMSRLLASHNVEVSGASSGAWLAGAALAELAAAPPQPRAEAPVSRRAIEPATPLPGLDTAAPDETWLDEAVETAALAPPEQSVQSVQSVPEGPPSMSAMSLRLESGALPEPGQEPIDAPIVVTDAVTGLADEPPDAPAPVPDEDWAAATAQATPDPAASAILPETGVAEERDWLRRMLGAEYGLQANAVSRILSEHPGFQGVLMKSQADVLTDAVAVRLHLSQPGAAIDMALRTNVAGPHVPFARCVVSGLNRLPSHRGPAVFAASPTAAQLAIYEDRALLTEWSFVHALTAPCAEQEGDTDVVIWSMSARRTRLLEPAADAVPDRVVFVPGTCFKILRLRPATRDERGQILLRELTTGEIAEDGQVDVRRGVLDDMAVTSLTEQIEKWSAASPARRVGDLAAARFGALPGLA